MRVRALLLLLGVAAPAGCGGGSSTHGQRAAPPPSREVVLGAPGFVQGAVGWGAARPDRLDVGGDPALVIHDIRWRHWGAAHAEGVGRAPAFNLHGGSFYARQVRVELRAGEVGRCATSGPRAYHDLRLRMPERPGAPMGRWFVLGGGSRGLCRRS